MPRDVLGFTVKLAKPFLPGRMTFLGGAGQYKNSLDRHTTWPGLPWRISNLTAACSACITRAGCVVAP